MRARLVKMMIGITVTLPLFLGINTFSVRAATSVDQSKITTFFVH